jgi:hypothetical protein
MEEAGAHRIDRGIHQPDRVDDMIDRPRGGLAGFRPGGALEQIDAVESGLGHGARCEAPQA